MNGVTDDYIDFDDDRQDEEPEPEPEPGDCPYCCLLYTSDAADERSSVDLGGRRIIKKKIHEQTHTQEV